MATDIERRRQNPGVINLKEALQYATNYREMLKQEKRAEISGTRTAARTAVYSRYPEVAAQELGMELPGAPSGITPPRGMGAKKVVYDEYGNPTTTYEAPEMLDEPALANMYNTYVTEVRKTNAQFSTWKGYTAIPIPSFEDWKKEYFPEYAEEVGGEEMPTGNISINEWLTSHGYAATEENEKLMREANPGVFLE